jgi:hypothetical protein
MAKILIVNNTPFAYPQPGEQAPWGEGATGWAEEVTKVLGTLKGSADILQSSYTIENNVSSPLPVGGLIFDVNLVRAFSSQITIYRTDSLGNEKTEYVSLNGLNQGSSGWTLQQDGIGNSGVSFSIDISGQIYYTSSNLAPIAGIITFKGTAITY